MGYLQSKNVKTIFSTFTSQMLREQPDDPIQWLHSFMAKEYPGRCSGAGGIVDKTVVSGLEEKHRMDMDALETKYQLQVEELTIKNKKLFEEKAEKQLQSDVLTAAYKNAKAELQEAQQLNQDNAGKQRQGAKAQLARNNVKIANLQQLLTEVKNFRQNGVGGEGSVGGGLVVSAALGSVLDDSNANIVAENEAEAKALEAQLDM